MKLYLPAALLVVALILFAPLVESVLPDLLPSEAPASYPVLLDPPRVDDPSWAISKRIRWGSVVRDALEQIGLPLTPLALAQPGGVARFAQVVEVAKSGARFASICGMTIGGAAGSNCSTGSNVTCVAGSARASITDSSITKPYVIHVNEGIYNECIGGLDGVTDISIVGSGYNTVVYPNPVTSTTSVDGGAIRIGVTAATLSERIEIANLRVRDLAFNSPEPAIFLGTGTPPTYNEVYLHNLWVEGIHDGIHWSGTQASGDSITDLPRFYLSDSVIVSGGDALAPRGNGIDELWNLSVLSKSDYCTTDDAATLASRTGTVVNGGSTTSFVVAIADHKTVDNSAWSGRKVTFSAGTCAAGHQGWITTYVAGTDVATFAPAAAFTPDNTCTYVIDAVKHDDGTAYLATDTIRESCTDVDYRTLRAGTYWKTTAFHFTSGGAVAPDGAIIKVRDSSFTTVVNDWGPASAAACTNATAQTHVAGILAYGGATQRQRAVFDNVKVKVQNNIDVSDAVTCVDPIAGISLKGGAFEGGMFFNGTIEVNNTGDPDENVRGVTVDDAGNDLVIGSAYIDVNNTAAGYAGTSTILNQTAGTLTVGSLTSPDIITSAGTIGGEFPTACASISPLNSESTFDQSLLFDNSGRAFNVEFIGCRCQSPGGANCGTIAQIDYQTLGGAAVGTTFTCADEGAAITWQDVRADGDAVIAAGGGVMFLVNDTPATTLTNNYFICLRYTSTER